MVYMMLGTCRVILRSSVARSQLPRLHSTLTASAQASSIGRFQPVIASLGVNNPSVLSPSSQDDISTITTLTANLRLRSDISRPTEYQLPTHTHNSVVIKHTIVDPLSRHHQQYDLPCHLPVTGVTEKVTPAIERIAPVSDPTTSPVTHIETMPYLVNIRHKKMKKHKLRKFRKRMIFVHRKLTAIKNKRKERAMVAIEHGFATSAQEFDAEQHIQEHIKEAKRGAWKIDVIQKWKSSKETVAVQSEK